MLDDNFWIMQVPVLSTIHISKATSDWIDDQLTKTERDQALYIVEMPSGLGWMIYASDDNFADDIPADLVACLRWNINNEYEWLRLDRDGEETDELPKHEW